MGLCLCGLLFFSLNNLLSSIIAVAVCINIISSNHAMSIFCFYFLIEYRLLELGQKLDPTEKTVMSACADALVKLGQVHIYF